MGVVDRFGKQYDSVHIIIVYRLYAQHTHTYAFAVGIGRAQHLVRES